MDFQSRTSVLTGLLGQDCHRLIRNRNSNKSWSLGSAQMFWPMVLTAFTKAKCKASEEKHSSGKCAEQNVTVEEKFLVLSSPKATSCELLKPLNRSLLRPRPQV